MELVSSKGGSRVNRPAAVCRKMKQVIPSGRKNQLAAALAELLSLDFDQLQMRWQRLFGSKPRFRLSRRLLQLAIAYRLQEQVAGGLQPHTRRRLAQLAGDQRARPPRLPRAVIRPGMTLVREWRGVSHQVTVVEDGVLFRGQRYRSLTQVADLITGTHWSGPRFFGLTSGMAADGTE